MAKTILIGTLIALLLLSGAAFAGMTCSADAYRNSCAGCAFDANGKIDQKCYQEKKSAGIACVSASHAIASAAYAAGKCPGIDTCASQLQSCQAQMSSGNDSADCKEGSMNTCFAAADICVDSASLECGERPTECKAPGALIMLVVGLTFVGFARKG
jgi:hypothetical protein